MFNFNIKLFTGIVMAIAGIMMIAGPLLKKNDRAKWVNVAFIIAGIIAVVVSILIFCLFFGSEYFSPIALTLLEHFKTLLSGFMAGVIVTLAVAGQLKRPKGEKSIAVK